MKVQKTKKILFAVVLMAVLYLILSYFGRMTGTVVAADTNQPIEGAAVLVEWSFTVSIGFSATDSYKVVETTTDKEGKFTVYPVLNPFVDPPIITIYKKDYVAWNNEVIFPEGDKRNKFEWGKGAVIKMEMFKENYSHNEHVDFVSQCIRSSQAVEEKKGMIQALDWEESMAFQERRNRHR